MQSTVHPVKSVPSGAWDTHHHIFEPERFPFAPGRHFTPSVATLEQLQDFEKSIGVGHVCIAHGLSYGADCASLLYYLGHFNGQSRGICVLDETSVSDAVLDEYHEAGIRSVRLDFFRAQAMNDLDKQIELIEATAKRLLAWHPTGHGWSIQIQQPNLVFWKRLRVVAANLGVPLVVDHMALVKAASAVPPNSVPGIATEGWQDLLAALGDGHLWIKISAPYRCSRADPDYSDLAEVVRQLVAANSKRVVWGSDWPHTQRHEDRALRKAGGVEPFLKIDNKSWIQSLSSWMSETEWQDMWVNNPCKLYDFQELSK
ncbi:amidohydrolase 2 [Pyrenochaeta sp. DS3sAY3a]|nr:amidohydrolase 2 [Pyrenochaeta sp. DS3sAY3a]